MSYFLVNDDDGKILAVLESPEEVASALEQAGADKWPMPLAVVAVHEAPGSVIGTETTLTMRPLR